MASLRGAVRAAPCAARPSNPTPHPTRTVIKVDGGRDGGLDVRGHLGKLKDVRRLAGVCNGR